MTAKEQSNAAPREDMMREALAHYEKLAEMCSWHRSDIPQAIRAYYAAAVKSEPAEGAGTLSSITHSPIGSAHWYRTHLSKIKDMGEFLAKHTPDENILRQWGNELYESSLELLKIADTPSIHPTAEGAEEILKEIERAALNYDRRDRSNEPEGANNDDYIGFENGAKWAMSHTTLHAQRLADKMVEERMRDRELLYDILVEVAKYVKQENMFVPTEYVAVFAEWFRSRMKGTEK